MLMAASRRISLGTSQRTQSWLAASDDPTAKVSGRYWHHMRQEESAREASDSAFQDRLFAKLEELTGVALT